MMIHYNKSCLEEKDPVTNLYLFMLAATSGFKKDLNMIYKLLCYRPEVLTRCFNDDDVGVTTTTTTMTTTTKSHNLQRCINNGENKNNI